MSSPAVPVADLRIVVNGRDLPLAARADVASVTVVDDVAALSMFELVLHNWDPEQLAVTWSDATLFAPGAEVQVWLGQVDDLHEVMTGQVTGLEPNFGAAAAPMLTVRGYDLGHRLARGRRTRTFARQKDSGIAAQLAREAGLRPQVTDSKVVNEYVVQHNQTDLEFLRGRAALVGYQVYVREKVLHFAPPRLDAAGAPSLEVGREIVEFTPRLRTLSQVDQVSVRGWDVRKKVAVVGAARTAAQLLGPSGGAAQAKRAFGAAAEIGVATPVPIQARADQVASAGLDARMLEFVTGEVRCSGDPRLRAGSVVQVRGAGTRFSGSYFVRTVTHMLTPGSALRTELDVARNAT
ncbi:MAG: phage late control D family protein [Pseudonocardia sp.]